MVSVVVCARWVAGQSVDWKFLKHLQKALQKTKKRGKKMLSREQQMCRSKRLVDDMGRRSEWVEFGWIDTTKRQQKLKQQHP